MEFAASRSVVSNRIPGLSWVCPEPNGLGGLHRSDGRSPAAVPPSLARWVQLPQASRLLQRTTPEDCPRGLGIRRSSGRTRAPPVGFRGPSSRHQLAAATCTQDPTPALWSVLGVPPALDGFIRCRPCGFVSPHSRVQGSPFRGLLLQRSRTGFPRPLPSCRCSCPSSRLPGAG
jgi:hypothetical protein